MIINNLKKGSLMKTNKTIIAVLALSILAVGCANRAELLKEQGFSDNYILGDTDGCASGKSAAKGLATEIKKDETLFKENKEYKKAWSTAHKECKREEVAKINKKLLDDNIREQSRQRGMSSSSQRAPVGG